MPKATSKATPKRAAAPPPVSTRTAEALRMLGLDPGSSTISKGQIGASYRKKAQEVHPDKALQRAHILTQALNNAKEHLDSVYP
jgi:hypothetical protein